MESLAPGEDGIVVERVHQVGLHVTEEMTDLWWVREEKKHFWVNNVAQQTWGDLIKSSRIK